MCWLRLCSTVSFLFGNRTKSIVPEHIAKQRLDGFVCGLALVRLFAYSRQPPLIAIADYVQGWNIFVIFTSTFGRENSSSVDQQRRLTGLTLSAI